MKLRSSIKVDGQEVKQLSLSEPTVGKMKRAEEVEGEISQTIALISVCANITEKEVSCLKTRDFGRVDKAVRLFFNATDGAE